MLMCSRHSQQVDGALLSSQEIEAFFAAAATLNAHSPWRWQAVAFFTLMHSCGLRTGETRCCDPSTYTFGTEPSTSCPPRATALAGCR